MTAPSLGVLGARSFVGESLLSLLQNSDRDIHAFSRKTIQTSLAPVAWHDLSPPSHVPTDTPAADHMPLVLPHWCSLMPIWALPEYLPLLEKHGAKRVIALSTSSRLTKQNSSDPRERKLAERIALAEDQLEAWANHNAIEWIVLRPTLIYGYGRDKNISEIARLIRRFGFFPVFGKAEGLRQPIHTDDVANACIQVLETTDVANRAYTLAGQEKLSYHDMVRRIFTAMDRSPRLLRIGLGPYRAAVACLQLVPRYKDFSVAMAERMNEDLAFDISDAERDFGFTSRPFDLSSKDLPD